LLATLIFSFIPSDTKPLVPFRSLSVIPETFTFTVIYITLFPQRLFHSKQTLFSVKSGPLLQIGSNGGFSEPQRAILRRNHIDYDVRRNGLGYDVRRNGLAYDVFVVMMGDFIIHLKFSIIQ
jgi:hypothetical protein